MDRWAARISLTADNAWECVKAVESCLEQNLAVEDIEYKYDDGYKSVFFSCDSDDPCELHLMLERYLEENGIRSNSLMKVERVDGKGKL